MTCNVSCDGHVASNVSCDGHVASNVSCDSHVMRELWYVVQTLVSSRDPTLTRKKSGGTVLVVLSQQSQF